MSQFVFKLKKLQRALTPIRHKYDDVLKKVDDLRDKLCRVQDLKAQDPHDTALVLEEGETRQEFLFWNKAAVSYMNQKTKESWILQGH